MAENNTNQDAGTNRPEEFEIAVLPIQNTTLFPDTVVPLTVGRARSLEAVEAALGTGEKLICCISLRTNDVTGQDAKISDLYEVGTLVTIKRMMRADETMQLIVQGVDRVRVSEFSQEQPFLKAKVKVLPELSVKDEEEVEALKRSVQGLIQEALAMLPNVPPEIRMAVLANNDPVQLAYFLASVLDLGVDNEQKMLEADTADELLSLAYRFLTREVEIMQIRTKIASEAQTEMDKSQRDYILRQQMKAIQKELGDDEGGEKAEAEQLRGRLETADLHEEVRKEAERELRRMEQLPQAAPDYHVIRTYLEYVLELPWKKAAKTSSTSLKPARYSMKIITDLTTSKKEFSNL